MALAAGMFEKDEITTLGILAFAAGMLEIDIDYEDFFGWLLYYKKASPEMKAAVKKLGQEELAAWAATSDRCKKRRSPKKRPV